MSAYLFIRDKRKEAERIDTVGSMSLATNGDRRQLQAAMEKWARSAEIRLTFED